MKKAREWSDGFAPNECYQSAIFVSLAKVLVNDKNLLLVRLNIRKTELYVKKKKDRSTHDHQLKSSMLC